MLLSNLWALARAEIRSCLRLVRTWVFISIATLFSLFQWLSLTGIHAFNSTVFPASGIYGPRYLASSFGGTIILVFIIGMIFLAFDVRTRDTKNRIVEVLDSRPFSNLELLLGRLLGIVLVLTVPTVGVMLTMYVFGLVAEAADFAFGSPMESASVFSMLVWDVVPNLIFWGALTVFLTVVVRYRLLVVILVLGFALVYFFVSYQLPYFLAVVVTTVSGAGALPSELAPEFFSASALVNRLSILFMGIGLLALAAGVHPRQTNRGVRPAQLTGGLAAVLVGVIGIGGLLYTSIQSQNQITHWTSIHVQQSRNSSTDIKEISGTVEIFPGRDVKLDLVIALSSTDVSKGEAWLLNLNPGYRIEDLSVNGESTENFEFNDGLLEIPTQNDTNSVVQIGVVASGVPDSRFAYLDSQIDLSTLNFYEIQNSYFLGQKNYIFHPQYVALMPGVSWIPTSGSATGKSDWEDRASDYFDLNIEVSVPQGWLVAGPGTRESVEQGKRSRFRFNPSNPVPEFALIAAAFERFSLIVGDIEFELLLSKNHAGNLDTLSVAVPAIEDWIKDRLSRLAKSGLEYPFGTLHFVEVPLPMRVYGGGWRLDSVFAPPGIQMFRESGLPIARFDNVKAMIEGKLESDDALGEAMFKLLTGYFENDYHGGNPLIGAPRNFVNYQTMPTGHGATAISFVVNELANKLITGGDGYFSTYMTLSNSSMASVNAAVFVNFGKVGFTETLGLREQFSDRPSVWERVLTTALSDIDFDEDPESAYHMLLLKGNSIARSLIDGFGEETVGSFLKELTTRYRGKNYTEEDLIQTGLDVGLDFESLLGDWLNDVSLPGFIVADPKQERLADGVGGESTYQASFLLTNGEDVPGLIRVSYEAARSEKSDWRENRLDPMRIEANSTVRIAVQSGVPISRVVVNSYLSLNRQELFIQYPELEDYTPTDAPQMPLVIAADWSKPDADSVIVDDLDEGFAVESPDDYVAIPPIPPMLRPFVPFADPERDHGLQTGELTWEPWTRSVEPASYGRYRHTFAQKDDGPHSVSAKFSAELPSTGLWKLEYHLCCLVNREDARKKSGSRFNWEWWGNWKNGNYSIEIRNGTNTDEIDLSLESAWLGWNEIGSYEIEERTVAVVVSMADGTFGVADAVKWTPLESTN